MEDSFQAQIRYFQVQIEQAKKKPAMHKNIIDDCRYYLRVLEETGSLADFKKYVQQTGNMLSTGKAEISDRYRNRLYLYEKLGSLKKVKADQMRLDVIGEAQTHQQLYQALEEIEKKTTPLEQQENKAIMAAAQIMKALFHLCTDPPESEGQKRSLRNLNEYWKMLREADDEISWQKLTTYPPYRNRMIFTDSQIDVLEKVFLEAKDGFSG